MISTPKQEILAEKSILRGDFNAQTTQSPHKKKREAYGDLEARKSLQNIGFLQNEHAKGTGNTTV